MGLFLTFTVTQISLFFADKRLCKEGESMNPEKLKLTNDIRDVLKGKNHYA